MEADGGSGHLTMGGMKWLMAIPTDSNSSLHHGYLS